MGFAQLPCKSLLWDPIFRAKILDHSFSFPEAVSERKLNLLANMNYKA